MTWQILDLDQAQQHAIRLQSVVHPARLRLLTHLITGPATVTEASRFLEMSVSNVSRHLNLLRAEGLVEATAEGRCVIYQLNAAAFVPSNNRRVYGSFRLGPCFVQIMRPVAEKPR